MSTARLGTGRDRYKLERSSGRFSLAEGLTAPGAITPEAAAELVIADLHRQEIDGLLQYASAAQYREAAADFARFARAHGAAEVRDMTADMVLAWLHVPTHGGLVPALSTQLNRRTCLRAFFVTAVKLGIHDQNPAAVVELDARPNRYLAPLTHEQIEHLKVISRFRMSETRTPALLALYLLGATGREASFTRVGDIDLANRRVWLHDGGERTTERWVPIDDDWCYEALAGQVLKQQARPLTAPNMLLIYRPNRVPNDARRQSAISMLMTSLLKKARLHRPGEIRVESIREYVALRLWAQTGDLGAVAHRLGFESLDRAAYICSVDWKADHTIGAAPPTLEGESW